MLKKLLFSLMTLLFISCSGQEYVLMTVLTDQKDMILVSEYYNSLQEENRLSLIYDDYISLEDVISHEPDIVISRDLNNPMLIKRFLPLQPPQGIYKQLSLPPDPKGRVNLIPLAFDLPALIYDEKNTQVPLILDETSLREISQGLDVIKEERLIHKGFSPLWSREYLYWFIREGGISFCTDGLFVYDEVSLQKELDKLIAWMGEDREQDNDFSEKYRYIPDYKLLKSGYIDFLPMLFSRFVTLPGNETVSLVHSWYGNGEQISPLGVIYAGVSAKSDEKKAAAEFLNWLVDADIQEELIHKKGKESPGFALFDSFSSIEEVNRLVIPRNFPEKLGGKLFLPEQLSSPVEEPENWSAVKEFVIYPWLWDTLEGKTNAPLSSYFREWQLQFID